MTKRSALCLFCDDIREEVGGKYSAVGIWSHRFAASEFPLRLVQCAIVVYVRTPHEDVPDRIAILIERPGDVAVTLETNGTEPTPLLPPEMENLSILHLRLPNFEVKSPGPVTVFVEVEGERLRAGTVIFARQEASSLQPGTDQAPRP